MGHVVAVAHVGEVKSAQLALLLDQREEVGERLAWMEEVCEAVDNRHSAVFGQIDDVLVVERAGHDGVEVAAEHAGRVGDRLAATELHVGRRQV